VEGGEPGLDHWRRFGNYLFNDREIPSELLSHPPPRPRASRRQRKPAANVPDGLKTAAQAAAKLGCSIKTLNGYVELGALKYVALGHGKRRQRRMFTDSDLNEFIANQTRKDEPCPSTASTARHTGISTFTGEVIDFRGPRRPPPSGKRKR
jgi:hypothetical protein